ncbi:MAG: hypothetical protein MHM6MM_005022 [Cercozoa sp. M6MM]
MRAIAQAARRATWRRSAMRAASVNVENAAFIADDVRVQDTVSLDMQPDSSIFFKSSVRGADTVRIGARSNVQDACVLLAHEGDVEVGDDVTIGHGATLVACTVEDKAVIGIGASCMKSSRVGEGAILAAGAVLNPGDEIPAGELWGGRPAAKIRDVTEKESAAFAAGVTEYVSLAKDYAN